MADYTSKAQIVLTVNGKQAEKMLKDLEKQAVIIKKKMDDAAKIGDKGTVRKLSSELKAVERQINQIKGASQSVEQTLQRLDKATPKELNKVLSQLKKELNGIERGSAAWDAHIQKIKDVKKQIKDLNESMEEGKSIREKIKDWIEDFELEITGIVAVLTGLVLAGKKAVNAYSEMEQEMANVRKYTGMTEEDVQRLNEAFSKMNTRTSREELNKLAQEAGRLGKTSVEEVLGFVKAADKINVALDDLGDGATLTLSKLTGIFGDEKRLGTEKALLSVGSVINELSQNCSASAPYLAEFTSRLGGVGAQAGMTVQQIMAYAAVLDSNEQKLEQSATALSQMIVRIYRDPAKYAKAAGMDVSHFTKLVKVDMNAALLEFLQALKNLGGMDVLSPVLKDMGENGAGVTATLSTLAKEIDNVKKQQVAANEAFEQAISIDAEFDVQNNTVQAGFDKAKNRINEIAVALGEKLRPVMSLVVSSSTLALKALAGLVDFTIKYKTEIITAVSALAAYNIAINIHIIRTTAATKATLLWNSAIKVMSGVVPALKLMFAGLANGIQYFTNGLRVNYAMQQRWQTAMAGMKLANWTGLILAAAAAVFLLVKRFKEAKSTAEELAEARKKIEDQTLESTKSEISILEKLYEKSQDQNASYEERSKAIKRLKELYPEYFKDLSNEAILAGEAADAYQKLKDKILETARARYRDSRIQELEGQINELQSEYNKQAKPFMEQSVNARMNANGDQSKLDSDPDYKLAEWSLKVLEEKYLNPIKQLRKEQESLAAKNLAFDLENMNTSNSSGSGLSGSGGGSFGVSSESGSNSAKDDRFKKEREWKEKEEALSRIAYATGEKNYIEHCKRMDEIAVEYNAGLLMREDLTDMERTKIFADFTEAQRKQEERFHAESIDAEEKRYNKAMALLKQYYIDGKVSQKAYDDFSIEVEAEHQQTLINLFDEGSKERLQAEQKLRDMMVSATAKRIQETERLEKEYASIKSEFFGDSEQERQTKLNEALDMLKIVYDREITAAGDNAEEKLRIEEAFEKAKLALRKKYGMLGEAEQKNAMQAGIESSVEWLNSDGGRAVTGAISTLSSGMSSIFSQLTDMVQNELAIQTAEIEKRYESEMSMAEGNSYQIAKLEKQKEAEIAQAKNEANRKMYSMQVMQAIAQTATGAINAYSSAAAVPVVGYILAPIAAAAAVAAGMIQVANIKKQQEASAASGYAEGGFTEDGDKYQPAGIVHAGEWVASQRLVRNPRIRPIINALEYAQRNNVEPYMSMDDVSMRLTAPAKIANGSSTSDSGVSKLIEIVDRLNKCLDEPLVAVATIAGDKGIEQKKRRYDRLMKNKG